MRDEPAALGAIRTALAGHERELLVARIRKLADRLGYDLLDVLDPDTVPDLEQAVRDLDVDAVITPTAEHLDLARIARVCEVIILNPETIHYRDGHREPLA